MHIQTNMDMHHTTHIPQSKDVCLSWYNSRNKYSELQSWRNNFLKKNIMGTLAVCFGTGSLLLITVTLKFIFLNISYFLAWQWKPRSTRKTCWPSSSGSHGLLGVKNSVVIYVVALLTAFSPPHDKGLTAWYSPHVQSLASICCTVDLNYQMPSS